MKLFILLSIWIPGWANAQPVWVKTPYWQTAINKNQTLKVKPDIKLDEICDEYALMVADAAKLSAREIETLRSNTDQISESQFNAVFTIDRVQTERLIAQTLRDVSGEISQASAKDAIPRYTQNPASLSPFERISGLQIMFAANSLSRISQAAGLRPLKIEVAAYIPEIKFRVFGRDSVCDLYSGKAAIAAASVGSVKISLDEHLLLNEFYQAIEDVTESAFKRTQSPIGRMAVLGYNLGPALAPLRLSTDKALVAVENLVSNLFDAQGERNEVWSVFNGKPHLSVNGSAQVQFQLRIER